MPILAKITPISQADSMQNRIVLEPEDSSDARDKNRQRSVKRCRRRGAVERGRGVGASLGVVVGLGILGAVGEDVIVAVDIA